MKVGLLLFATLAFFVVVVSAAEEVGLTGVALPLNTTEIIRDYGYRCDDYWAETEDGYLLALVRIYPTTSSRKGVVLFQHGLTDNSNGVVLNPPDQGLPFILADNGYEVWLGNNRGNGYSMRHNKYTTNDHEFWQFTWDHMAQYDLPATINFALKTSGADSLTHIGHSEGTIQAFAGFSSDHTIANGVNLFIALAPVAYVGHLKVLLINELARLSPIDILLLLGVNEFNLPTALQKLIPHLCDVYPPICRNILDAIMGPSSHLNTSRLPYYLHYEPNPTSVLNMIHWSQGASTNKFQHYDYGLWGNLQHYGQLTPPPYHLSEMPPNLPVVLFTGGNDYLADPTDVARLIMELNPPPAYVHDEPTYAHVDFLWATDANKRIYPLILNLIKMYSP